MGRKILLALILPFALLGCGGGDGGDRTPPSVTAVFSRTELPFGGGTVQVTVTISDPSGVAFAQIDVSPRPPNFSPTELAPQNQQTVTANITISLPANGSASDMVYQVRVTARDVFGNEGTVVVGEVRVRSPLAGIPNLPDPSGAF
ncbi:MAG: hypothetical protein SQA66_06875 [Candidatus Fervidibacter sacchari]